MTNSVQFAVQGMTCAACVGKIERALAGVPGVSEAVVNLATGRAEVAYDPARAGLADLEAAVESAGYGAAMGEPDAADAAREEAVEVRRRQATRIAHGRRMPRASRQVLRSRVGGA